MKQETTALKLQQMMLPPLRIARNKNNHQHIMNGVIY